MNFYDVYEHQKSVLESLLLLLLVLLLLERYSMIPHGNGRPNGPTHSCKGSTNESR
jgi:hypothetical protein